MKLKIKPTMSALRKMNKDELDNYLNEMRRAHRVFKNKKKYDRKKYKKGDF